MFEILVQRAMTLLLEGPCPTKELIARIAGHERENFRKSELTTLGNRMRRAELVRVLDGKYFITDAGKAAAGSSNKATSNTTSKLIGSYTCPELGRTCHRQGAYDFLDIPSVFGSEQRPYKFRSGVN